MASTRADIGRLSDVISELLPSVIGGTQLGFFLHVNITSSQIIILMKLYSSGRQTIGELAAAMGVSMPTASGIVSRLLKLGYLVHYHDEKDRRRVYVELSPNGRKLVSDFKGIVKQRWQAVLMRQKRVLR